MAELPTGTVTFLFTDIEGSTRLWDEHPEQMKGALARHDEILRDAVEVYRGHVVKTTGDGVHAAFATAHDAVEAAVHAQRVLGGEAWEPETLLVRMGVHTGEAELRDGDYYGSALNRAARLMGVAHGGQVLLSHVTEELVDDTLSEGIGVRDLGEHRLRDLSRPERVFQVMISGHTNEFPPLRSLDAYPGNLPVQLTSFVGRDREVDEVADALEKARLVTLTGTGGVGKTRLSLQVAAAALPSYPDGAWICELAAADSPESMLQVVAATLGSDPRAGSSIEASVVEFLRGRRSLLLLDNCEHLLSAVAALASRVMRECPEVAMLATSREGLAVDGESVIPLRSLPVPGGDVTEGSLTDAVRLFVDRAHAARADFKLDATNASAVAEICRRLDGIPLAIELAAARVVALTPTEIAARLDERFRLLSGGRRSAMERHQTLRAAVDWSYSLLSETERVVFDRLGVFAGTFDVDTAEAVVAGDDIEGWDVIEALMSLVAKSMVVAEDSDGASRYAQLETMRQYARERLDERGETDHWRRRHAERMAEFAEGVRQPLEGPDEPLWRSRLMAELDNLRAAVVWALDAGAPDDQLAVRVVAALAYESYRTRTMGIGAWSERAADAAQLAPATLRTAALGAAAWHTLERGDPTRGEAIARDAIRDGIPFGCPAPVAAIQTIAVAQSFSGDFASSVKTWQEGHEAVTAAGGSQRDHVILHAGAASLAAAGGDIDTARSEGECAVELARSIHNPAALASALTGLSQALETYDPPAALAAAEESIALTRAGAGSQIFGNTLALAGRLRARSGDFAAALRHVNDAVLHCRDSGDRSQVSAVLDGVVEVAAQLGDYELVARLCGSLVEGAFVYWGLMGGRYGEARNAALERARDALGAQGYERATAAGASMSFEEVVEYTVGELDRMLAEADDDG